MNNFTELKDDIAYKKLNEKYIECELDYVLLSFEGEYKDAITHKKAVLKAFDIFANRYRVGNRINPPRFTIDEDKMECKKITLDELLSENKYIRDDIINTKNYFRAFSDPPYGTPYTAEDFRKLNHMLFPEYFRNDMEVYIWNDDFSDYFDDGKEWWGTALWSVFDKAQQRFVIIGASLTD